MYRFLKSALAIAVISGTAAFQPLSAAAVRSTLPVVKTLPAMPSGFAVDLSQVANEESVHFTVRNFSGNRLRCSLKAPDGSLLETVYIKGKQEEASRNYLFTSAEEGIYTIEVTDGKETIIKKIDLHRTVSVAETQFTIK